MSLFDNFLKRFALIDSSIFKNKEFEEQQKKENESKEIEKDKELDDLLKLVNEDNSSEDNASDEYNNQNIDNTEITEDVIENFKSIVSQIESIKSQVNEGRIPREEIVEHLSEIKNFISSLNIKTSNEYRYIINEIDSLIAFFNIKEDDIKGFNKINFNLPTDILNIGYDFYSLYRYINLKVQKYPSDEYSSEVYEYFGDTDKGDSVDSNYRTFETYLDNNVSIGKVNKIKNERGINPEDFNINEVRRSIDESSKADSLQKKLNELEIQRDYNTLKRLLSNIIYSYFYATQTYNITNSLMYITKRILPSIYDPVLEKEIKRYIQDSSLEYDPQNSIIGLDYGRLLDKFKNVYREIIEKLPDVYRNEFEEFRKNNNVSESEVSEFLKNEFKKTFMNLDIEKPYFLNSIIIPKLNILIIACKKLLEDLKKKYNTSNREEYKSKLVKTYYEKLCSKDFIINNIWKNVPRDKSFFSKKQQETDIAQSLKMYFSGSFINSNYRNNSEINKYIIELANDVKNKASVAKSSKDINYTSIINSINLTGIASVVYELQYFYIKNSEDYINKLTDLFNNKKVEKSTYDKTLVSKVYKNQDDNIIISKQDYNTIYFLFTSIFKRSYNILKPIYDLRSDLEKSTDNIQIENKSGELTNLFKIIDELCQFYEFLKDYSSVSYNSKQNDSNEFITIKKSEFDKLIEVYNNYKNYQAVVKNYNPKLINNKLKS